MNILAKKINVLFWNQRTFCGLFFDFFKTIVSNPRTNSFRFRDSQPGASRGLELLLLEGDVLIHSDFDALVSLGELLKFVIICLSLTGFFTGVLQIVLFFCNFIILAVSINPNGSRFVLSFKSIRVKKSRRFAICC
jgi:hypothetical protein